ncbi:SET domain-containing protein [Paraburkholderia sp. 31.1]|nr:SET domain-containing protein [Paraburkholderia sp. 31.1]
MPRGMRIIEYRGARITHAAARRQHPVNAEDPFHTFLFALGDGRYCIDAGTGGNAVRWINHRCAPNCEAVEDYDRQGILRVYLHAAAVNDGTSCAMAVPGLILRCSIQPSMVASRSRQRVAAPTRQAGPVTSTASLRCSTTIGRASSSARTSVMALRRTSVSTGSYVTPCSTIPTPSGLRRQNSGARLSSPTPSSNSTAQASRP